MPAGSDKPITLFRFQFYTGFIKLFKLDLAAKEIDQTLHMPDTLQVACTFTPGIHPSHGEEDPYEALIVKESSSLWSEVLKKKEARMNKNDVKESRYRREFDH